LGGRVQNWGVVKTVSLEVCWPGRVLEIVPKKAFKGELEAYLSIT